MKKIKAPLAFLFLVASASGFSIGQESIILSAEETATASISFFNRGFVLSWMTVAQFPKTSERKIALRDFNVTGTDFQAEQKVTQTGTVFWIQGETLAEALRRLEWDFAILYKSGYRYPSLQAGFWYYELNAKIGTSSISFELSTPRIIYFNKSVQ